MDPTTLVAVVELSDAELDELVEDAIVTPTARMSSWLASTT
jgi:hypothetical protein